MSDTITLIAAPRAIVGKHVERIRREGLTPAVLYGPGVEPVALQTATKELARVFQHVKDRQPLDLQIEGEAAPRRVRLQDLQQHVTRLTPLHADFMQLS